MTRPSHEARGSEDTIGRTDDIDDETPKTTLRGVAKVPHVQPEAQLRTEQQLDQLTQRMDQLIEKADEIIQRMNQLIQRLDEIIQRMNQLIQRLDEITHILSEAAAQMRELVGEMRYVRKTLQAHLGVVSRRMESAVDTAVIRILKKCGSERAHRFWTVDGKGIVFEPGTPVEIDAMSIDPPIAIEFTNELRADDIERLLKKLKFLEVVLGITNPSAAYIAFEVTREAAEMAEEHGIEIVRIPEPYVRDEWQSAEEDEEE